MHTKIKKASKCSNLSHTDSLFLNQPKEPASTPRTSIDLALLIYKGKHAQIKNKYFCLPKII
jgi:hypothetical protein